MMKNMYFLTLKINYLEDKLNIQQTCDEHLCCFCFTTIQYGI